jgi:hypothetical protein
LEREMGWTVNDFNFQRQKWLVTASKVAVELIGHRSYALRQAAMYQHFANQANSAFTCALAKHAVSEQA